MCQNFGTQIFIVPAWSLFTDFFSTLFQRYNLSDRLSKATSLIDSLFDVMGKDRPPFVASSEDRRRAFKFWVRLRVRMSNPELLVAPSNSKGSQLHSPLRLLPACDAAVRHMLHIVTLLQPMIPASAVAKRITGNKVAEHSMPMQCLSSARARQGLSKNQALLTSLLMG